MVASFSREFTVMMRFVSKKELRQLVLYSPQHIQRLEDAGKFPKRVRLGTGPRCRVGWVEQEVEDWLKGRIHLRDKPTTDETPH
jgi:prophage regulatory protein